jgi:hypothetical protein
VAAVSVSVGMFADRIFPICGTTYCVAVLVILVRILR